MVIAADHMRDLHLRIVDDDHVVVDRNPRRTHDDRIADRFAVKSHIAANYVVKIDWMLGNL